MNSYSLDCMKKKTVEHDICSHFTFHKPFDHKISAVEVKISEYLFRLHASQSWWLHITYGAPDPFYDSFSFCRQFDIHNVRSTG